MTKAENAGLTNSETHKTIQEITVAMGDSLSDLASSDAGEDWDDEDDEETEQRTPSEDDEPGWVIGTMSKLVQQCMGRFRKKQMKLDEVTQPGWDDPADYFGEWYEKFSTSDMRVLAVTNRQTDEEAAAPALTTFGQLLEILDIVPWILVMPQETPWPGSSHNWLGSGKPQWKTSISRLAPGV